MTKRKAKTLRSALIVVLVLTMLVSLAAPVFAAELPTINESVQVIEETSQPQEQLPTIENNNVTQTAPAPEQPTQQAPAPAPEQNNSNSGSGALSGLDSNIADTADTIFGATDIQLDMNAANQSLGGLKTGLGKIFSLILSLLMIWIILTFFADIICRFVAPLKPTFTTKIPLASSHVELLNGTGIKPWIDYGKERLIELVMAFALLILVVSNTHVTVGVYLANFLISLMGKAANFLMGLF